MNYGRLVVISLFTILLLFFVSYSDLVYSIKEFLKEDPWVKEQQKRKEQVIKVCQKYGKIMSPSTIPLTDFFYVPRYHMLYCRIQKCGTTSWVEGTLQGLAPSLGLEEYKDIKRKRNKFKYFEVNDSQSWNHILEENPLSIVHVRHPFERLASGYLDKIIWKGMSFHQFVEFVISESRLEQDLQYLRMNIHWRPMIAHCFFCSINYTVISKMETYSEDKDRFLKMVGIKENIKEERMNVRGGESIQDKTRDLFKEIKGKDLEALKRLYKYDLELFDYDPHVYG